MNFTIYTLIKDFSLVRKHLTALFADVTAEVLTDEENGRGETGNAIDILHLRFQDNSEIRFTINHDSDYINAQIPGMINFFSQAPCKNEDLKKSVLVQISVFNCVIGCVFDDGDDERINLIVHKLLRATDILNGLALFPNMSLVNGSGKLVLSIDGKTELDSYTPIGNSDVLESEAEESTADIDRRERSIAVLKKKKIPYLPKLKAAVLESEAIIRSADEIIQRLFAMYAVCVYCEVLGNQPKEQAMVYVNKIDAISGVNLQQYLTPEEKAVLAHDAPDQHMRAKFGWRYECCYILLWALGFEKKLCFPSQICDMSKMASIIWSVDDFSAFKKNAKMKSKTEILDAADLILRYHWACVDARIHQQKAPANLNGEVVFEWHYAMNWLLGANNRADWDDISPNT